jgi:hypothetical protein
VDPEALHAGRLIRNGPWKSTLIGTSGARGELESLIGRAIGDGTVVRVTPETLVLATRDGDQLTFRRDPEGAPAAPGLSPR